MNRLGRYKSAKYDFIVDQYCDIMGYHITIGDPHYVDVWIRETDFSRYIENGEIKKISVFEPVNKLPKFSF
jgi:hypothetical protein